MLLLIQLPQTLSLALNFLSLLIQLDKDRYFRPQDFRYYRREYVIDRA